jgi:hypothetical protein
MQENLCGYWPLSDDVRKTARIPTSMRKFLLLASILPLCFCAGAQAQSRKVQIEPRPGNGRFCLDARGDKSGNGTLVFTYQCHDGANQRWEERPAEGGAVSFVGLDGKCLDVRGTHSRKDGTPVQLWACHGGGNQSFKIGGDGRIREVQSGKCLISTAPKDGAPVVLDDCKNTPDEQFDLR